MTVMAADSATALTAAQAHLLPGGGDIAFYHEHGFWISGAILPDALIDAAIRGAQRFYAGERDRDPPKRASPGWSPADGDVVLRKNDFTALQIAEIEALVRYPLLGAVAARLAGEPVRLWHDQLLCKPVDGPQTAGVVGWHTDRQYWRCCTSMDMLTAWIPFRDYDENDGTLTFIDGSHRWPGTTANLDFRQQDLDALEQRFGTAGQPVTKVPVVIKKGQVSFHHCRTIHGSGPNRGHAPRTALAVHLQPASNRWRQFEYRMPDGSVQRHDLERVCRQCDGVPDYTDPAICPQLWPVPAP